MTFPVEFAQAFSGGLPVPQDALPGVHEAVVASADATGLRASIPGFHPGLAFGPCAWSKPPDVPGVYTIGYPPVGTRCLLVFAGNNPWIIGFNHWPA